MARGFALILTAFIPGAASDRETLRAAYDAVEGIESRSIDNGRLVSDEHTLCIVEGVDDYCARISESDLEDRLSIFPPPSLADRSMVFAKCKEMSSYWKCAGNFGNSFNVWNIRCGGDLDRSTRGWVGGSTAYIVDSIQEDCNCETSCSDLIAYARQN